MDNKTWTAANGYKRLKIRYLCPFVVVHCPFAVLKLFIGNYEINSQGPKRPKGRILVLLVVLVLEVLCLFVLFSY